MTGISPCRPAPEEIRANGYFSMLRARAGASADSALRIRDTIGRDAPADGSKPICAGDTMCYSLFV